MPPRGSLARGQGVRAEARRLDRGAAGRLPQAVPFADGTIVPLRGVEHRIVHRPGAARHGLARAGDDGEPLICVAGDAPHVDAPRRRLPAPRGAARSRAREPPRYASSLGVTIKRISVRDQSSRWGSCSTTGVLSFSWRLILAPPFVLDYLAVHEVAHLVEMNHSPRFWRLVHRPCPDAERAKAWLDVHGADLHRYGLSDEALRAAGSDNAPRATETRGAHRPLRCSVPHLRVTLLLAL